jgi:circadian clock protein KaiB
VEKIILRLFVAGRTSRSERAIANLRRLIDQALPESDCSLTIINVVDEPQLAEAEHIIATPTLIKDMPFPSRRIIGDLSGMAEVLDILNLPPYGAPYEEGHYRP